MVARPGRASKKAPSLLAQVGQTRSGLNVATCFEMAPRRATVASTNSYLPDMNTKILSKSRYFRPVGLAVLLALTSACGRPATEAECRDILKSAALLELKAHLGNQELIATELKAIETAMEGPMMEKCVGKRISEEKLTCIRGAKSSEQLFGECF